MVLYTKCSKNGRVTDLGSGHALTRLENLYRTLTDKLFREYYTTSKCLGPGNGYENVMKGDQHKVQDAKRYEGNHAQSSMDNKKATVLEDLQ